MSLPDLIAILSTVVFGIFAISSSMKIEKAKEQLSNLETAQKLKAFEETLLSEIADSLDYSLDIAKITAIFSKHFDKLFPYTTLSTIIVADHKLIFTASAPEAVSYNYLDQVKELMLESLSKLEKRSFRDVQMTEDLSGTFVADADTHIIESFFHLPLMLHNSVAAIITVTSTQPRNFPSVSVTTLQKVAIQTARLLSKFDAALQVEKSRLTSMVASLSDGLFMIDTKNKLQLINPAAKQLLSLPFDPITTMDVLSALPINFDFGGKIQKALQEERVSEIIGVTLKNKKLRCGISPVHSSTGKVIGASVIMRDETLKHAVPRMKEDFTNIIVHELRSPLTSIKASSELLISPMKFSPEEQKKLLTVIFNQSNKLLGEVQNILDAAKLEAGVFTIHKHQNDLKELIVDVAGQFENQIQEKMISFTLSVDPHMPRFSFDAKYLSLALANVLSNSLKFTSMGGKIQISARQKHASVVITITDSGAGIPKDKQHQLFSKFSQIQDPNSQVGTGLGLYLVKGVMESHGGKVEIDSDQGRGTTILLTLPLTDANHFNSSEGKSQSEPQRAVN